MLAAHKTFVLKKMDGKQPSSYCYGPVVQGETTHTSSWRQQCGVDVSDDDSPLRRGVRTGLQFGFRDGDGSVSNLGKRVRPLWFSTRDNI